MHRHCVRSTLSQCASATRNALVNTRHFATSLALPEAGPSRVREASKKQRYEKTGKENTNWKGKKEKKGPPRASPSPVKNFKLDRKPPPIPNPTAREVLKFVDQSNKDNGNLLEDIIAEDGGDTIGFTPGTFVEIRRNEQTTQALVLGEKVADQRWAVISLTEKGKTMDHFRADVYFAVPNLVSADLAESCGLDPIPTPQQNMARIEALKRIRSLTTKVERHSSGLQMRPMNVYEEVCSEEPDKWTSTDVESVTNLLYERPTFMDYYSVHKYLMDRPLRYVSTPGYLKTQRFDVRPRQQVEEILGVEKLIYDFREQPGEDGVYKRFITKARKVVEEYDKTRRRDKGPITQEPQKTEWEEEDQIFLKYLVRSLQPHRSNQADPFAMGRTILVREILSPQEDITDSLTHELLVKLGVLSPWYDPHELIHTLSPWGDFSHKKGLASEGDEIVRQSSLSTVKPGNVVGPYDFLPVDPLDAVRHDFGDRTVFVIDDPTAEELDDGVSLERIPSEPDNYWVHVHIADPTHIIHPQHALAKLAMDRYSTFYLTQRSFPLLPVSLVHHPQYRLSLNETTEKIPTRAMSFSVKVNENGDLLDHKVRAGIIRNVKKVSYDDVDHALGFTPPPKTYPLGGGPSSMAMVHRSLSEADTADLRILQRLADTQALNRGRQGIIQFGRPSSEVSFKNHASGDIVVPSLRGSIFHGFPDIEYAVHSPNAELGARCLITEMMKLANRVASRTLVQHGLPAIHRAMEPAVVSPESMEILSKLQSPRGHISIKEIVKHLQINPAANFTLEAAAHYGLGVPHGEGYVRATSPLRRVEDMVIHWQLQHMLLGKNAPAKPPFTAHDMERLVAEFTASHKVHSAIQKGDQLYSSLLGIKRYAENLERTKERGNTIDLGKLRAWTIQLSRIDTYLNTPFVNVLLPDLGIVARLENLPPGMRDIPLGTDLYVKYKSVCLGIKRMRMSVGLHQEIILP